VIYKETLSIKRNNKLEKMPLGQENLCLTTKTVFQFICKYQRFRQLVWRLFPKRRSRSKKEKSGKFSKK